MSKTFCAFFLQASGLICKMHKTSLPYNEGCGQIVFWDPDLYLKRPNPESFLQKSSDPVWNPIFKIPLKS